MIIFYKTVFFFSKIHFLNYNTLAKLKYIDSTIHSTKKIRSDKVTEETDETEETFRCKHV